MTKPTYQECLHRGMSVTETAMARDVSKASVSRWAKRHGVTFRDGRKDPAHAERMRALNADPEFAAAHAERMRARHADPEFAAANAERMRARHADPEFAAAHAERMRARHADPEFNPLAALTEEQRADYDTLKKNGFTREEAFAAIGFDPASIEKDRGAA